MSGLHGPDGQVDKNSEKCLRLGEENSDLSNLSKPQKKDVRNSQRIISWNVNGLRSILSKEFDSKIIQNYQPDIICLQEIKANSEQVDWQPNGYSLFWNSAKRPGYSGTLTLSKRQPLSVERGYSSSDDDSEGRVLTLEYEDFFLVNVYTPNAKRDLSRLPYRFDTWDPAFCDYVTKLSKSKEVVFCGDLNVAHQPIDLANPKTNTRNAGFTEEERSGFSRFLEKGFVDLFREFDSSPGKYTWWSYRTNARSRNIGWRIDYFCSTLEMRKSVKDCQILDQVTGSDHCPVLIDIASLEAII